MKILHNKDYGLEPDCIVIDGPKLVSLSWNGIYCPIDSVPVSHCQALLLISLASVLEQ